MQQAFTLTFDWVSPGWPGNTLNTLQENWSLFLLAYMLLQQEEDHLPGRAELHSLSDLDGQKEKTNDHNLSRTQKIQTVWQEYWKRLKLLLFNSKLYLQVSTLENLWAGNLKCVHCTTSRHLSDSEVSGNWGAVPLQPRCLLEHCSRTSVLLAN